MYRQLEGLVLEDAGGPQGRNIRPETKTAWMPGKTVMVVALVILLPLYFTKAINMPQFDKTLLVAPPPPPPPAVGASAEIDLPSATGLSASGQASASPGRRGAGQRNRPTRTRDAAEGGVGASAAGGIGNASGGAVEVPTDAAEWAAHRRRYDGDRALRSGSAVVKRTRGQVQRFQNCMTAE